MAEIIGHVIAAEGQHGHGIAARNAHRSGRGRSRLRCHGRADVNAVLPVHRFIHQRRQTGAAAAKEERGNRDSRRILPARRNRRRLIRRHRVTRIRLCRGAVRTRPRATLPIDHAGGSIVVHPLPPRLVPRSQGCVRENRIFSKRGHHIGVGLLIRSGGDAEEPRLGIDRVEVTVRAGLHPRDVVADGPHAIALVFERRNHHGQVRLSTRARERCGHVSHFSIR